LTDPISALEFDYFESASYYDFDYWNTPGMKSGYVNMSRSLNGDWHSRAAAWFNRSIPLRDKILLDAGCGLGHFMLAFQSLGAIVSGADISDYSNEIVAPLFPCSFHHSSLDELFDLEDSSFDIVFCSAVMEHILPTRVGRTTDSLLRITKPGGLLFFEIDTKPNALRPMPEASHICIRPRSDWLQFFDEYAPALTIRDDLEHSLLNDHLDPGFPHPDWSFHVLQKRDI